MAFDMFIKIGDIKGESHDKKRKDDIDIISWSWGMTQSASMHVGSGGGSGKVSVNDLTFTKYLDRSTPTLILFCCSGKHIDKATLFAHKAGGDSSVEFLKIEMKDVVISSVSTGGSDGAERLTENITLNFAEVKVTYVPQDAKGGAMPPVDAGWNIKNNCKLG